MSIVSRILALVTSVGTDIKDLYQKYINLSVGRVVYLPVLPITVAEDTFTLFVNYTPGLIRVSHTGTLLRGGGVDYTATNGTSIVFTFELKVGDEVDVERISVDNNASPVTVGGIIYNPPVQFNIDTVTNTIELDYNPNAVRVYHTGILLRNGEDYTATSGTEIVFTNTLQIGDEVDVERITIDSTDQPTLNEILNAIGVLSALDTDDKSSLVAAINELKASGGGGGGITHDIFTVVVGRNDTPITVSLGSQIPGAPSGTLFEVDQLGANLATGGIYKLGSGGGWTLDNALTADGIRTVNVLYGTGVTDYRSPGMRVYKRVSGATSVVINSMNTTGILHKNGTTYTRLDNLLGDLTTLNTFVKSSVVAAINDLLTNPALSGMPVSVWDVVNSCSTNATDAVVLGTQIPGAPNGVVWAENQRRLDEENGNIYTVDSSGNMGGEDFFNPQAIRLVNVMYGLNSASATPAGLRIVSEAYSGFGVQTFKQNTAGITHARGNTYAALGTEIGDLNALTTPVTTSLVAALNSVEKSTNKNVANGYAGLDSTGGLLKSLTPEFTYNAMTSGFDNDPSVVNTGAAGNSGTGRFFSGATLNGFEIVLANNSLIRYKLASSLVWSSADSINTTALKTRVVIVNNKIIVLDGESTTRLGWIADFTGTTPVWTAITHPTLTKKWYDATWGNGYYVIVGEQGAVTVTADFVTFTNSVVDTAGYGATPYDIFSIIYQPLVNRFMLAGLTQTTARSRSGGIFAAVTLSPTAANPLSFTWTNVPINSGSGATHCGKKVDLVGEPTGTNYILNLRTDDFTTYGTRYLAGTALSLSFPNAISSTAQVPAGHPNSCGSWYVFYHSILKNFVFWPARPQSGAINPFLAVYYVTPLQVTTAASYIRTKYSNSGYWVMEGENGVIINFSGGGMTQRTLVNFTSYIPRRLPLINNRDWNGISLNAAKLPYVAMRLGTLDRYNQSYQAGTLSSAGALNAALSAAPSGQLTKVTFTGTNPGTVASQVYRTTGRCYFEVQFVSGSSSADCIIGLAGANIAMATLLSEIPMTLDVNMIALGQTGWLRDVSVNAPTVTGLPTFSTINDVLCVAVDLNQRVLWWKVNNGLWNGNAFNDPVTGAGGYQTYNSYPPGGSVSPYITNNVTSEFIFNFIKTSWQYTPPPDFAEWEVNTNVNSVIFDQEDVQITNPRRGQSLRIFEGMWKNKFDFEVDPPNTYATTKDGNGIYTVVDVKTKDGRLAARSTLSGGTSPNYTTRTFQYYDLDGTTVLFTQVFTLTYDGTSVISEVLN